MNKINIGLIGYGTVGSGVAELLSSRRKFIKNKFKTDFAIKSICDLDIKKRKIDFTGAWAYLYDLSS